MKKVLFYTFLAIFVAATVVTLLGVTGQIEVVDKYLNMLVPAFLISLAGAVIAVYRKADILGNEPVQSGQAPLEASRNSSYVGTWDCSWEVDTPEDWDGDNPIEDIVEVEQAPDGRLVGTSANTGFGTYHLLGEETAFGITFSYRGTGDRENLVGVVLLRKKSLSSEMNGRWWQLPSQENWVGGTCEWRQR